MKDARIRKGVSQEEVPYVARLLFQFGSEVLVQDLVQEFAGD
jgi:hypothetical protein